MKRRLIDLLACPRCHERLNLNGSHSDADVIMEGALRCERCAKEWPILRGIPRFVTPSSYADSFGLQWNAFRREQLDRYNGTELSSRRFFGETSWSVEWMAGRRILDVGCGAGRFLDVAASTGADVVGVDLSNAVDAAAASLAECPNVHLVQASIYELPFRLSAFDGAYCIGVIQHTPDPSGAIAAIPPLVKPGGRLAFTIYERRRFTKLYSKYLWRPITCRMDKRWLLAAVAKSMPVLFPITDVLFRVPQVGRYFQLGIPVANYVHEPQLSREQRYRWAVLDTFDMLAPEYDQPQTYDEVCAALARVGVTAVERLPNIGLNVVAER